MKLFRVLGIQLELHVTFLLLLLWAFLTGWADSGWVGAMVATGGLVVIFACVVLHELGHCVAAMRYHVPIRKILLLPIGGMAQFGHIPKDPRKELVITLAGPLVNLVIVVVLLPFASFPPLEPWRFFAWMVTGPVELLVGFNAIMGLFNLLPLFPMDGGRILRAILAMRLSYLRATKWAVMAARPLLLLGIAWVLVRDQNFLTAALFAFIYIGGDLEYRMVRQRERFAGYRVRDFMRPSPVRLPIEATVADLPNEGRRDVLLVKNDQEARILPFRDALRLRLRGQPEDTLYDHGQPIRQVVHANWSLTLFLSFAQQSGIHWYPVQEDGQTVGVIFPPEMERLLEDRENEQERREEKNFG